MAMLRELTEFRSRINQKLCSDQKIVDLMPLFSSNLRLEENILIYLTQE